MYVRPPSFFFLFLAKIEKFLDLHLHITKICTLYYLFRVKTAFDTNSKLVCSLVVRLEVKSLCGTSTDVSKLVRSRLIRIETRVSMHPRSKTSCWRSSTYFDTKINEFHIKILNNFTINQFYSKKTEYK